MGEDNVLKSNVEALTFSPRNYDVINSLSAELINFLTKNSN